ncbi:MAG TPA: cupin domain-containing protein [Candidatus Dormibacteraeota bacterium]
MAKPEREFFATDDLAFTPCAGEVASLTESVLATDHETGVVSSLMRFAPGTDTTPNGVQTHDCWEEVDIVAGSITDLRLNETFTAGMYACRPPGMPHGPWRSEEGCVTFQVRHPG